MAAFGLLSSLEAGSFRPLGGSGLWFEAMTVLEALPGKSARKKEDEELLLMAQIMGSRYVARSRRALYHWNFREASNGYSKAIYNVNDAFSPSETWKELVVLTADFPEAFKRLPPVQDKKGYQAFFARIEKSFARDVGRKGLARQRVVDWIESCQRDLREVLEGTRPEGSWPKDLAENRAVRWQSLAAWCSEDFTKPIALPHQPEALEARLDYAQSAWARRAILTILRRAGLEETRKIRAQIKKMSLVLTGRLDPDWVPEAPHLLVTLAGARLGVHRFDDEGRFRARISMAKLGKIIRSRTALDVRISRGRQVVYRRRISLGEILRRLRRLSPDPFTRGFDLDVIQLERPSGRLTVKVPLWREVLDPDVLERLEEYEEERRLQSLAQTADEVRPEEEPSEGDPDLEEGDDSTESEGENPGESPSVDPDETSPPEEGDARDEDEASEDEASEGEEGSSEDEVDSVPAQEATTESLEASLHDAAEETDLVVPESQSETAPTTQVVVEALEVPEASEHGAELESRPFESDPSYELDEYLVKAVVRLAGYGRPQGLDSHGLAIFPQITPGSYMVDLTTYDEDGGIVFRNLDYVSVPSSRSVTVPLPIPVTAPSRPEVYEDLSQIRSFMRKLLAEYRSGLVAETSFRRALGEVYRLHRERGKTEKQKAAFAQKVAQEMRQVLAKAQSTKARPLDPTIEELEEGLEALWQELPEELETGEPSLRFESDLEELAETFLDLQESSESLPLVVRQKSLDDLEAKVLELNQKSEKLEDTLRKKLPRSLRKLALLVAEYRKELALYRLQGLSYEERLLELDQTKIQPLKLLLERIQRARRERSFEDLRGRWRDSDDHLAGDRVDLDRQDRTLRQLGLRFTRRVDRLPAIEARAQKTWDAWGSRGQKWLKKWSKASLKSKKLGRLLASIPTNLLSQDDFPKDLPSFLLALDELLQDFRDWEDLRAVALKRRRAYQEELKARLGKLYQVETKEEEMLADASLDPRKRRRKVRKALPQIFQDRSLPEAPKPFWSKSFLEDLDQKAVEVTRWLLENESSFREWSRQQDLMNAHLELELEDLEVLEAAPKWLKAWLAQLKEVVGKQQEWVLQPPRRFRLFRQGLFRLRLAAAKKFFHLLKVFQERLNQRAKRLEELEALRSKAASLASTAASLETTAELTPVLEPEALPETIQSLEASPMTTPETWPNPDEFPAPSLEELQAEAQVVQFLNEMGYQEIPQLVSRFRPGEDAPAPDLDGSFEEIFRDTASVFGEGESIIDPLDAVSILVGSLESQAASVHASSPARMMSP